MSETVGRWNKSCVICKRLDGKVVIVTGSSTGIGLCTAGELARRGATVIMACRNMEKAESARKRLLEKYSVSNPNCVKTDVASDKVISSLTPITANQLIIEQLDLASLKSVKGFAIRINSQYTQLHYLINNAGILSSKYKKTEDGFEMTMGVNYFGHFLLTELLLPLLKASAPSRIINVSSMGHYYGRIYKPDLQSSEGGFSVYCASKLANVLHAYELNKRLEGTGVVAVSLHPGTVNTELQRDYSSFAVNLFKPLSKPFFVTPWKGAQTTIYTVLTDNLVPGGYYTNCTLKRPSSKVKDDSERKWFWNRTCELLSIECNG
ncbi:unnamed protein product [Heterobilharzia americana]|nr:unnamed protein product [Heterobilharzia americana]CAH8646147.1 unnamed protein product [Heterobilharzia americana]CAH8665618.1 unnamed protein product [Heterobilharzia americana]CAH8665630.1 unnamed protein product [Heterobilharzia americana]